MMFESTNAWEMALDVITAILILLGTFLSLAAAIGLVRFPDLMSRMHAATKPQVLGLLMLLTAVGLAQRNLAVLPVLALAWLFQLLTVPVSAHMMGRAGYRTRHLRPELLAIDELDDVVRRATAERAEAQENDGGSHQT